MLKGGVILEVGIRGKTDRRVLAKIVLVDQRVVMGDCADIGALAALESGRIAFLKSVKTILTIRAEIHPVCPYIPTSDWNSFFSTRFGAFKTG
jgi:hypothetical protein